MAIFNSDLHVNVGWRRYTMRMQLYLNGETRQFEQPLTIAGLLMILGLSERKIAVEVGRVIIPKSRHGVHLLQEGDRVEIIQAMGGG